MCTCLCCLHVYVKHLGTNGSHGWNSDKSNRFRGLASATGGTFHYLKNGRESMSHCSINLLELFKFLLSLNPCRFLLISSSLLRTTNPNQSTIFFSLCLLSLCAECWTPSCQIKSTAESQPKKHFQSSTVHLSIWEQKQSRFLEWQSQHPFPNKSNQKGVKALGVFVCVCVCVRVIYVCACGCAK